MFHHQLGLLMRWIVLFLFHLLYSVNIDGVPIIVILIYRTKHVKRFKTKKLKLKVHFQVSQQMGTQQVITVICLRPCKIYVAYLHC